MPAGWGTAFWLPLIFNGGRAGSLADARQLHFEHGVCADLQLAVDSAAGAAEALAWRADLCEAYFKRPPKTRSNHIKLATPFPFGVDWRQLVSNWRRAARPDGAPTDAVGFPFVASPHSIVADSIKAHRFSMLFLLADEAESKRM